MTDDDMIDNADAVIAHFYKMAQSHPQPILPGPVDDAVLLARYEGTTALLPYQGLYAKCQGCGTKELARFPVGKEVAPRQYVQVPNARVVPPVGWQEGSKDQPMLCPCCLAEVAQ